jgi:hypothetical protein
MLFKRIIAVAIVISIGIRVVRSRRSEGFSFKLAVLSRLFSYGGML